MAGSAWRHCKTSTLRQRSFAQSLKRCTSVWKDTRRCVAGSGRAQITEFSSTKWRNSIRTSVSPSSKSVLRGSKTRSLGKLTFLSKCAIMEADLVSRKLSASCKPSSASLKRIQEPNCSRQCWLKSNSYTSNSYQPQMKVSNLICPSLFSLLPLVPAGPATKHSLTKSSQVERLAGATSIFATWSKSSLRNSSLPPRRQPTLCTLAAAPS